MEITTSNNNDVSFRPVEEKDVDLLYRWNNQDFLGPWQGVRPRSIRAFRKRFEDGGFNTDSFHLFLLENAEKTPIGLAVCEFVQAWIARIGLSLKEEFRGAGFGERTVALLMEYLFSNYPIQKIEAETDVDNVACKKIFIKLGFVHEGTLRCSRFHHGKFHDALVFGILRGAYESK